MKKLRKLLAISLAMLLSITVLAACGNSGGETTDKPAENDSTNDSDTDEPDSTAIPGVDVPAENPEDVETDPNKLVLWSLFSGGDGAFMDQIITEYNATSPTKEVQSVMLVWGEYYTKLATAVATGNAPDIGVSHASKLPELVDQAVIIPIDQYAQAAGTDWTKYADGVIDSITFGSEKYALPLDVHAEILYFNKDIIAAADVELNADGLLDINSDQDLNDILTKVNTVIEDGGAALSFPQSGDEPYRIWWATYFQMNGSDLVNDAGDEITINREIAIEAAEYVKTYYSNGFAPAGIQDHQMLFQSGAAGLSYGGTWAIGVYEDTENLNYGAQPMPKLFDNDSGWADAHTLIMPTNKDRNEADTQSSVDFINYVSSEGAKTWALSGQIPSNTAVQGSSDFTDLPQRVNYVSASETAVFPSKSASFYAMKDVMIENLNTIWLEQVEVEAGIDELISQLEIAIQ